MPPRVIYTPPHTFATISGYQPASLLDDMFYAIQNADVTLKTDFLTVSYTIMPSDNYSTFICQPVTDMTLTLPSPSNYFSFQFFNATATSYYPGAHHNVTLVGAVVVAGVSKVNPVFPDANNVLGGLVIWDGSQWQMFPLPFAVPTSNVGTLTATLTAGGVAFATSPTNLLTDNAMTWDNVLKKFLLQKSSNVNNNAANNGAVEISHTKNASAALNNAEGLISTATDPVGGATSFIEGLRGQSILSGGSAGSAYGVIGSAQTASAIAYTYLVGFEGQVINNSGTDATLIFNNTKFSASFLATGNGTNLNSAGFMTNPFSDASAKFRAGFLVTESAIASDGSGFMDIGTHIHGLDLSEGSFSGACIIIPNNSAIRAKNAAMTQDLNIAVIDGSNQLILGFDTVNVLISANGGTTLSTFTSTLSNSQTAMFLLCQSAGGVSTLERVLVGAANSGGTGFRLLVVAN
jgi:hypothetical protein